MTVKLAIVVALDAQLVVATDAAALRLGISRSAYIREAVRAALAGGFVRVAEEPAVKVKDLAWQDQRELALGFQYMAGLGNSRVPSSAELNGPSWGDRSDNK